MQNILHALAQLLTPPHSGAQNTGPLPYMQHDALRPKPGGQNTAGPQQMIPVGQPIPKSAMNSYSPQLRVLAQIYNQNPQDSRVAHIDPQVFGYAPDNTARPQQMTPGMLHPALHQLMGPQPIFHQFQPALDVSHLNNQPLPMNNNAGNTRISF